MISQNYYVAFVKSGKYKEGLIAIDEYLKYDPKSHLHLLVKAQLLTKLNNKKETSEVLNTSLQVISFSDENYIYRKQALKLKEELLNIL